VTAPEGAVRLEYEPFLRRGNRTTLLVRIRPAAEPASTVLRLRLAQGYLEGMRVESVFPPPRRAQAGREHVTLDFDVDAAQPGPFVVAIHVLPERIGSTRGTIAVDPGPQLAFHQWVYP
jgi:hypothetical protein